MIGPGSDKKLHFSYMAASLINRKKQITPEVVDLGECVTATLAAVAEIVKDHHHDHEYRIADLEYHKHHNIITTIISTALPTWSIIITINIITTIISTALPTWSIIIIIFVVIVIIIDCLHQHHNIHREDVEWCTANVLSSYVEV